ncbi:MAG: T9SS type A sorting domain-containing protein [Flavobacteriales bacterium]|nr:T9SS type A sorting domain-containing protein [Flavobacteriales bacterium]
MKKYLPIFFPFVLFLMGIGIKASAQCPGCIVNSATCNPPGGGICPDSVPAATVGIAYNEDVTFYLPPEVNTPFGMRPLLQVKIDAITGLPFGINWQSNSPNNTYVLNGQGGHGCVKLCGTPIGNPGVYNITITVTALVAVGGILGNQTGQQTFNLQMMLLPGSSSNAGFSMAPPLGCEPLVVSFTNNNPSNYVSPDPAHYGGVIYSWNFGNMTQSNAQNPPPVLYSTAGNYPVNYSMTVDTFGFVLKSVTVLAGPCTDIFSAPDYEMKIRNSSNQVIYTGPEIQNTNPPITWNNINLGINPSNWPFTATFTDLDSGLEGGNDDCGTVTFSLPPVNSYGTTTQTVTSGSLIVQYTIEKTVITVTASDTVKVFALPPVDVLQASASAVCSGDSILLTIYPGFAYEWLYNDTIGLPCSTNECWVKQTGRYKVKVFNPTTGCSRMIEDTVLTFYTSIPSNFAITLNPTTGNLQSNISGSYSYQWQILSGSTWVNIPAPAGVQSYYTPTSNGTFRLIATNANGCTDTTNAFVFNTFGINDLESSIAFNYFPNPTQDLLNVSVNLEESNQLIIIIRDIIGKEIIREDWGIQLGNITKQINLQALPTGTYMLDVELSNGTIRKKLIKN